MNVPDTIVEAAAALRRGHVTPQKLVTDALERIERRDAQVRAWVVVDEAGAFKSAGLAAEELAAGHDRGPLHGIPLGIKDLVDVAGLPTRAGSRLTDPRIAPADATVVARLRAAGAVILGKTVTTEFACFDPSPTRNPWNLDRTPGGSSSGSAAAVAMEMCLGALGSQTGGSITRPASYCGVAGCKPTFGLVSRQGVVPLAFHLDHVGVIARTAADCAVMLPAIAGDDPRDPACVPRGPLEMCHDDTAAPRLGLLEAFFFEQADSEVARLTREALDVLAGHGAQVVQAALPAGFDQVHAMHRRLMTAEAADYHRRTYGACPSARDVPPGGLAVRTAYAPKLAELLDEGFELSMADYQEALRHQAFFRHSIARGLAGVDAWVTPATVTAAPEVATTGDPKFNSPWSHGGVPTVSIPCALTAAGLPISLQLIGPAWSDGRLLSVATWCEQRLNFRHKPLMARQR